MASKEDRLVTAYVRWVIRWRWPVLVVPVLVAAVAAAGLRGLGFTSDFRVFFGAANPERVAYEALEDTYTKTDNILFVVQPRDKDVFTRETLTAVAALTEEAWRIPYAIRVDSVTNFQRTEADGDDLTVGDLVEDPATLGQAQLARIKDIAVNEPALVKRLIAEDAGTTGVLVTLQFPEGDHTGHLPAAVGRAYEMVAEMRAAHPGLTVALTGLAVMSDTEIRVSRKDLKTLAPLMYLFIIAFMLALLRSVSGTLATLVVVSLSVATAMGLGAWAGMKMNIATAAAPIIILTLSVADSVHILLTAFHEMGDGRARDDALVESLRINMQPVFLTSLTTIIGFLSLNFSDSPPFGELGNLSAAGILAAWIYSMTVLPAALAILPLRVGARGRSRRPPMERFGDFVVGRRTPLLGGMSAVILVIVAFIPRIDVDDRFVKWFDESLAFRVDTDFATANLVGPYSLEFSLGAGGPGAIAEPAYLERVEAFAQWLRARPDIVHVSSFTDVMKRVNKSMNGDDPDWYRLPTRRNVAAQYLLLFEMSLPYGLDLNSRINVDKSATRLTATLDTVPTRRMREIAAAAESWLRANAPPAMWSRATGAAIMFAHLSERNIRSMLTGTALAFLLIAATLVIALRSLRLGAVSLLSNFLPVLVTFGIWAIIVGEIGIVASVIAATAMGLIVDDTVHLLSKYNRAKREHAFTTHEAVRFGFSHVGTALWVTTVILVAGFLILGLSSVKFDANMGFLTAIALVAALAVDFLLLPPLLMLIDRDPSCACATCKPMHATAE